MENTIAFNTKKKKRFNYLFLPIDVENDDGYMGPSMGRPTVDICAWYELDRRVYLYAWLASLFAKHAPPLLLPSLSPRARLQDAAPLPHPAYLFVPLKLPPPFLPFPSHSNLTHLFSIGEDSI